MPEFDGRQEWETRLSGELARLTGSQVDQLMSYLGDPPDVSRVPQSFWDDLGTDLTATLQPALQQIYVESAQQTLSYVPRVLRVDWTLANEPAAAWAETYSFALVTGINETSQAKLQDYVSNFFTRQGTTIDDLQAQIATLFGSTRADLIATTEITRAAVEGQKGIVDQIEQANPRIDMVPIWDTSLDEWVCRICAPRHNKPQGSNWTEPPPGHPRCRCSVRYEAKIKGKR